LRANQRGGQVDLKDLTRISEHLDTAIEQTHALIQPHELSVRPAGLVRALEDLARFSSARIPCEFRVEGEASTNDPQLAQAFYRVARESVQNILQDKKATRIEIVFLRRESSLVLRINCDRPPNANHPAFDGDGLLKRLAGAAGLDWSMGADSDREMTLQVSVDISNNNTKLPA